MELFQLMPVIDIRIRKLNPASPEYCTFPPSAYSSVQLCEGRLQADFLYNRVETLMSRGCIMCSKVIFDALHPCFRYCSEGWKKRLCNPPCRNALKMVKSSERNPRKGVETTHPITLVYQQKSSERNPREGVETPAMFCGASVETSSERNSREGVETFRAYILRGLRASSERNPREGVSHCRKQLTCAELYVQFQ